MKIDGTITFFYYNDLAAAAKFYGDVMGFEPVIDVEFAKVYKVYNDVHVGLVDGKEGYIKAMEDKPVMLSYFSDDIDEWHRLLVEKEVEIEQPPTEQPYLKMRTMLFRDPEGYLIEILQWLVKPYGKTQ
ncbi:MAG: VOC family protein [Candidatus Bathyarchaeota archaeon]|nr:VOC family protein [Candidatus Bathyarchaeota archaeon]